MNLLTIEEASAASGFGKDYIADAVRQGKVEATATPGAMMALKDGNWLAHQKQLRVQKGSLDTLSEKDVDGRYALLACLAYDCGADAIRRALHVWRGVVLDKPACPVARNIVSILEDAPYLMTDED